MTAGGRPLIDYKEAERQFVVEGKSLRQIATDLGLKSNSSISHIARREDWQGKREAYKAAIARRSYEVAAATVASQNKEIRDEAILAGRLTLRAYLKQFEPDPSNPNKKPPNITPRDAQVWAAYLLSETTDPGSENTEAPDVRNVTPPDADLLRRVVEAARGRVAPAGSLGAAPLVEPTNTRPN